VIVDAATGEPVSSSAPRADVYETLTAIQTAVQNASDDSNRGGGVIRFRRGIYDFNTLAVSTVLITLKKQRSSI
jgi:pectin methylesterase-like acyl-CoA thioesterase